MPITDIAEAAGGLTALAALCGCSVPNIHQLKKRGSDLPARFVLSVERGVGISRHRLRPDLYPEAE